MASLAIYTIIEADENQKARPKTLIAIDIDIDSYTLFLSINCATNIYPPYISPSNITPTPTPTGFLPTGRKSYSSGITMDGVAQTSESISVMTMAAPQLPHELSFANSSDSMTACGTGHAHSLSDCIKHCSDSSTNDAAFGMGSDSGIQSRGAPRLWQCCECNGAGQTVNIIACAGCTHYRCDYCTVYVSHK
ncbi:hypothetical protein V501_08948 [Pseudogymnoascus sp. VKM F-4519 (FW-2642)]|nr:hypothetical protein V501_08948 [Pseudogymnoascus sp. VKM F-4519 (FW-2642)]